MDSARPSRRDESLVETPCVLVEHIPEHLVLREVSVEVALEDRGQRAGRIRLRLVEKGDAENLKGFVREVVETGSLIVTDGAKAYSNLSGYRHAVASSTGQALDHYHTAVSNLKTWLRGTHHGRVEVKHLQAYLNEFAFRYNRRGNLAAAFQTILGLSGKVGEFTYRDIYADVPAHPANPAHPLCSRALGWTHP